jgi:hypothetical protein
MLGDLHTFKRTNVRVTIDDHGSVLFLPAAPAPQATPQSQLS